MFFLQKPPELVVWCAEMLAAGAASAPSADGEDAPAAPNFSAVLMGSKSSLCEDPNTLSGFGHCLFIQNNHEEPKQADKQHFSLIVHTK